MSDIVWQDPPPGPVRAPRGRWAPAVAELRANPKRWALIATLANALAARNFGASSRSGVRADFRPVGAWEFRTTGCDVYARYIGDVTP